MLKCGIKTSNSSRSSKYFYLERCIVPIRPWLDLQLLYSKITDLVFDWPTLRLVQRTWCYRCKSALASVPIHYMYNERSQMWVQIIPKIDSMSIHWESEASSNSCFDWSIDRLDLRIKDLDCWSCSSHNVDPSPGIFNAPRNGCRKSWISWFYPNQHSHLLSSGVMASLADSEEIRCPASRPITTIWLDPKFIHIDEFSSWDCPHTKRWWTRPKQINFE
jgi:hypothetical protein